jgi:hypothetical protein
MKSLHYDLVIYFTDSEFIIFCVSWLVHSRKYLHILDNNIFSYSYDFLRLFKWNKELKQKNLYFGYYSSLETIVFLQQKKCLVF